MKYTTNTIRKMFLMFFKENNHKIIPSSSLIPKKKSNLLFTNAGMNQFQDVFLGKKKYPFSQVVTIQKCLRTGGKHNDLDEVGYSEYHNTFFEMLGNFSFGTYFKKEAILYAWNLLTDKSWFNIPKKKLFVTVYYKDKETYNIWNKIIKLSKKNIIKIYNKKNKKYESDNFWQMGDTGPCGPCTEIFFKKKNNNNQEYNLEDKSQCIEIWNIVFIQFNRINKNEIIPLKITCVDTGMGLERIASVLQNVNSNYQIDTFKKIITYISKINNLNISNHQSLNVIADHIRAAIFIINENIIPSNEHRGYILRRIIRRALCHGNKIGIKNIFFYKLTKIIISLFNNNEKDLENKKKYIINILKEEELQFHETLNKGIKFLNQEIKKLKKPEINSKIVFYLYDTLGFPIDLTKDICREQKIYINQEKLNNIILQHKKNTKNKIKKFIQNTIHTDIKTIFCGYKKNKITATIKKIFINGKEKKKILKHETGIIILDITPFFGESGGQIGDSGIIYKENVIFQVKDTQNFINAIGHIGTLCSGKMHINDIIVAEINKKKRLLIQNNHTATHLLQTTLKKILKYSIEQKGSFINDQYLRFDFTYPNKINIDEIFKIEKKINQYIQKNIIIYNKKINFEQAKSNNYIFLKNKIYQKIVRTVSIGNISKEICKGTHTHSTGNIGIFKIILNKSISSGIRRIEAITNIIALKKIQNHEKKINEIKIILKSDNTSIISKIKTLINENNDIKKENYYLNREIITYQIQTIRKKIIKIKNINFLSYEIKEKNIQLLKILIDQLKIYIHYGIIILFYKKNKKYIFIVSITKNLIKNIQANKIIEIIKNNTQGTGGGKSELAQCIGKNIKNISKIIQNIKKWINLKL
ncbi:alanine--tRNA ligase [Buchnera aphidicola]|uniref:Alanine--tRNA ligase n=1 Tax=Buchnera aphidicola (Therioaphis trifolii) TaxID=1241884 RepID=A0A4D6YMV8_9GAMM|nr:alanine--tRNA ligase [Buchnera aphidicola]QCI27264.1 alanine--tRNA ligase [Buchnera aphidicola (Therioaphis trifolii)]